MTRQSLLFLIHTTEANQVQASAHLDIPDTMSACTGNRGDEL